MGLDTIELVMKIEEEYSIDIPDAVATKILTVGELARYIEEATQAQSTKTKYYQAYERIIEILINDYNVHPKDVTAESRFVKDLGLD